MGLRPALTAFLSLLLWTPSIWAISLNVNDTDSIKQAAKTVAYGLVSYYSGNDTGGIPGLLPYPPYYWWESGGMFNSLVNYWYYTGDDTYNDITLQGLVFQAGPGNAYMPPNQTFDEGNDDQMFWAFAAMTAAEYNFPNPPADQPQWLELAQGVFNIQTTRWEYSTCNGGMPWQINTLNAGYLLKTSAANCGFFNLAARLGAYTGNQTYFHWAIKTWDWMLAVGLIDEDLVVWDSVSSTNNCTTQDHNHWTYTTGMALNGAAVMWNQTQDPIWQNRTMTIWNNAIPFYFTTDPPMVMQDACEPTNQCNLDQVSFKAYLARFMAASTKVAPWLYESVQPYLAASAMAAAEQCDGGENQTVCGYHWSDLSKWDGTNGVGQQIAALEVIQANLIHLVKAPVSSHNGGTSQGNNAAGTNIGAPGEPNYGVISTADRVGADILTAVLIALTIGGAWWMLVSPAPSSRARFVPTSNRLHKRSRSQEPPRESQKPFSQNPPKRSRSRDLQRDFYQSGSQSQNVQAPRTSAQR